MTKDTLTGIKQFDHRAAAIITGAPKGLGLSHVRRAGFQQEPTSCYNRNAEEGQQAA
ncbi:MAG: hypothetical protein R2822_13910 [Spirosomataceae bacterium]